MPFRICFCLLWAQFWAQETGVFYARGADREAARSLTVHFIQADIEPRLPAFVVRDVLASDLVLLFRTVRTGQILKQPSLSRGEGLG